MLLDLSERFVDALNSWLEESRPATQDELALVYCRDDHEEWETHGVVEEAVRTIESLRRARVLMGEAADARRKKKAEPKMVSSDWAEYGLSIRDMALSVLLAQEAGKDADVARFRTEVLRERLLPYAGLGAWIDTTFSEDRWRSLEPEQDTGSGEADGHISCETVSGIPAELAGWRKVKRQIPPSVPGDAAWQIYSDHKAGRPILHIVQVPPGGILHRLMSLSNRLALDYGWQSAQAGTFILTGAAPQTRCLDAYLTRPVGAPGAWRVEMSVALTESPQAVAKEYKRLRDGTLPSVARSLSEKHLWLVFFAARHAHTCGTSLLKAWNKQFPKWAYTQLSNFDRDVRSAKLQILHLSGRGRRPGQQSELTHEQ